MSSWLTSSVITSREFDYFLETFFFFIFFLCFSGSTLLSAMKLNLKIVPKPTVETQVKSPFKLFAIL